MQAGLEGRGRKRSKRRPIAWEAEAEAAEEVEEKDKLCTFH
jgi:hypothetical protein